MTKRRCRRREEHLKHDKSQRSIYVINPSLLVSYFPYGFGSGEGWEGGGGVRQSKHRGKISSGHHLQLWEDVCFRKGVCGSLPGKKQQD